MLNEWVIAWVAHQVVRDPLHLFDANIFHPEPRTLAFTEHLFVPAMLSAPVLWLGGSPVLAHNLLLLIGFALTGWTMSLLIETWTGDRAAGILAGCLMAFNAHTLTRLAHVQAHHFEFLPLALLALDRVLQGRRLRDALRLSLWFVLQALCSGYLLVFSLLAMVCGVAARPTEWLGRRFKETGPLLALAAVLAALATAPFLLPYYLVRTEQGLVRTLDQVSMFSASFGSYFSTGGRLHLSLWGSGAYRGGDTLFPGVIALALVIVSLWSGVAFRDRRARMLLIFGVAGVLLSFGPRFPPYVWLYDAVPLLQGIRGAARFGQLALVAVAGLAGFGLVVLRQRWREWAGASRTLLSAATAVLIVAVNLEAARAPLDYTPFTGIPRVYDVLADQPSVVVAEMPFFPATQAHRNGPYVLASTRHFKPLLNGYGGFVPGSYRRIVEDLEHFPDARSLAALRAAGVSHVIVHTDSLAGVEAELLRQPELVLFVSEPGIQIYKFETSPRSE